MRVCILGFDGLEYKLVERFKLTSLKQEEYGKVQIPKECYLETVDPRGQKVYEPYTPFVWSAFLAGKLPEESGVNKAVVQKWKNPILQFLKVQSMKIWLHKIRGKGKILERIGFKRQTFSKKDYKCPTIFDYASNPQIINVPTVSQEWTVKLETDKLEDVIEAHWQKFYKIKKQTLAVVKQGDWDLLMSYTRLLDVIGELCFGNFKQMFKAYNECNQYVRRIKQLIDEEETICLTVSDHGMEPFGDTRYGKHSDYGFYSVNRKVNLNSPKTTDFYKKVVTWLTK